MSDEIQDYWIGWLVRQDESVLASVEVPTSSKAKLRGLIGRESFDGSIYFEGAKSIHTFGMKFALDVAFISADSLVIRTLRIDPNRITLPVWRSKGVIEAKAGAFSQWDLQIGQKIEIRK